MQREVKKQIQQREPEFFTRGMWERVFIETGAMFDYFEREMCCVVVMGGPRGGGFTTTYLLSYYYYHYYYLVNEETWITYHVSWTLGIHT